MDGERRGQVAVIFTSRRTDADADGYDAAAARMDALAARQPGYRGVDSVRGPDGYGITVSYWADEAAAIAWRHHPDHAAIR
ncbi:antibiotic biosynthesis monooxygenase family protein, partial [Enterococcus faecium]|uniref:antibiotic biosynthesis monooxygenase family protein n=2 Tax=Bacteria TaxID=2 RepID=UPI003F42A081